MPSTDHCLLFTAVQSISPMTTNARRNWLVRGSLVAALALGAYPLAARTPAKTGSAEMRFWDWTSLDFSSEEYAGHRQRLLDGLAADSGGILIVPGDHGTSHGV